MSFVVGQRVRIKTELVSNSKSSGFTDPCFGHIASINEQGDIEIETWKQKEVDRVLILYGGEDFYLEAVD